MGGEGEACQGPERREDKDRALAWGTPGGTALGTRERLAAPRAQQAQEHRAHLQVRCDEGHGLLRGLARQRLGFSSPPCGRSQMAIQPPVQPGEVTWLSSAQSKAKSQTK